MRQKGVEVDLESKKYSLELGELPKPSSLPISYRRGRPRRLLEKGSPETKPTPFPFELDTVQMTDCIQGMRQLPSRSVDILIADPPYNASKGKEWKWDNSVKLSGFGGNWTKVMESWDSLGLTDYLAFTMAWLA